MICGVSSVEVELMNNVLNGTDESIVGLGADFCLALSASLFASDFDRVEIVELSSDDNWLEILDGGEVDVIAGAILDFGSHVTPSNETETDCLVWHSLNHTFTATMIRTCSPNPKAQHHHEQWLQVNMMPIGVHLCFGLSPLPFWLRKTR